MAEVTVDDLVEAVAAGSLGYFWVLHDGDPPVDASQTPERHGFVQRRDGLMRVHLLVDDAASLDRRDQARSPVALLGVTEHTSVLILNLISHGGTRTYGGPRASTEHFEARTLVASPELIRMAGIHPNAVSMRLYSHDVVNWAGYDPLSHEVEVDQDNLVRSVRLGLGPSDPDVTTLRRGGRQLSVGADWGGALHDRGRLLEVALEITASSLRPRPTYELITMLGRIQELLSSIFTGFVPAGSGRAQLPGSSKRAQLWNSELMPTNPPSGVPQLNKPPWPLVEFDDIGGVAGLARWIDLCETHPRVVAPITSRWRSGLGSAQLQLLECAIALEYWTAAHRRQTRWSKRGDNFAAAVALHVGSGFEQLVGDIELWAQRFWQLYNNLKHDPTHVLSNKGTAILAESGYILLLSALLDRISGSKAPSRRLCGSNRLSQLRDALQDEAPRSV